MRVFLNCNHNYFITFVIISILTKFFKILFKFFEAVSKIWFCIFIFFIFTFMSEDDFEIKLKAWKKKQ